MPITEDEKTMEADAAFARRASAWIASFFEDADAPLSADIRLCFHRPDDFPDPRPERLPPTWLFARRKDGGLELHVCTEHMNGCPLPAIQASLEVELALYHLHRNRGAFAFNFQRRIQSYLGLSGSAVNLVRQMVWHLEKALQLQSATAMLIEHSRGQAQVIYFFYILTRQPGEAQHYRHMQKRGWVRGLYLCQMVEHYLPLALLQQAGMSPELLSFWQRSYAFLLPTDRALIERLARRAAAGVSLPFADRVVALFDILRAHLSI